MRHHTRWHVCCARKCRTAKRETVSLFFFLLQKLRSQNPPRRIIEYLCCVASYSFLDPCAQGPRQPAGYHASLLYCWVANYSNHSRKTKKRRTGLFLCPHPSAGIFCLWFLLFSITKGSFHCCQLNESLCVLHPIPAHHSLTLSLPLSLAAAVSSSFFLCIPPLSNIASVKMPLCVSCGSSLWRSISHNSCLSLTWRKRCACDAVKCCLADHVLLSTIRLLKGISLNLRTTNQYYGYQAWIACWVREKDKL